MSSLAEKASTPFPVDEAGNITASVVPRTGTLASLMALAGQTGEVASATDVAALVVQFAAAAGGTQAIMPAKFDAGSALLASITTPVTHTYNLGFQPKLVVAVVGVQDYMQELAIVFMLRNPNGSAWDYKGTSIQWLMDAPVTGIGQLVNTDQSDFGAFFTNTMFNNGVGSYTVSYGMTDTGFFLEASNSNNQTAEVSVGYFAIG